MWLTNFRARFLESVLDLLWAQWTTLGVFGQSRLVDLWPIDPESLIIATVAFGRYDPRLFDAFIEWWARNSQWVSSTRLQRFSRDVDDEDRSILSAVAESVLLQQSPKKWERLLDGIGEKSERLVPLLMMKDGSPLPVVGSPDPIFKRRGLLRPKAERREIAQAVEPSRPGNLRIKLRGLFGLTTRAEIVLFLLTHDVGHARLISRQAHYAYAPVTRAMRQMMVAGFLSEQRFGREVEYALDRRAWVHILPMPERMRWVNWIQVFTALRQIWACVAELDKSKPSEAILGPELYRCTISANRLLSESELDFSFHRRREGFENYPNEFESDVKRLFRKLGAGV